MPRASGWLQGWDEAELGELQEGLLSASLKGVARDLLDPGIERMSLVSPALVGAFFTLVPPGKPHNTTEYPLNLVCSSKG